MESLNPMGRWPRIISHGIAIVFLAFGVVMLYPIMQWPFKWDLGSIVFGLVFLGILFWLAYLCFKTARDFWQGPTLEGVKSLSILMGLFGSCFFFGQLDLWLERLTDKSHHFVWSSGFALLGILAAGIIYGSTKKFGIQYFHLSQTESAEAIVSRRKHYFMAVSIIAWSFFMKIGVWVDDTYGIARPSNAAHTPEWIGFIFPMVYLIVPAVLAFSIYKRCVRKFCNIPRE